MSSHAASRHRPAPVATETAPRRPRSASAIDLRLAPARSTRRRPGAALGTLALGILAVVAIAASIAILLVLFGLSL